MVEHTLMDVPCQILLDKRLLSWPLPAPGRVIFQECSKYQMDVCQKFLEGKIQEKPMNSNNMKSLARMILTHIHLRLEISHMTQPHAGIMFCLVSQSSNWLCV